MKQTKHTAYGLDEKEIVHLLQEAGAISDVRLAEAMQCADQGNIPLEEYLLEEGYVTGALLDQAMREFERHPSREQLVLLPKKPSIKNFFRRGVDVLRGKTRISAPSKQERQFIKNQASLPIGEKAKPKKSQRWHQRQEAKMHHYRKRKDQQETRTQQHLSTWHERQWSQVRNWHGERLKRNEERRKQRMEQEYRQKEERSKRLAEKAELAKQGRHARQEKVKQREQERQEQLEEKKRKQEERKALREEKRQERLQGQQQKEEERKKEREEKQREKQRKELQKKIDRDEGERKRHQKKQKKRKGKTKTVVEEKKPNDQERLQEEARREAERQFLIEQEKRKLVEQTKQEQTPVTNAGDAAAAPSQPPPAASPPPLATTTELQPTTVTPSAHIQSPAPDPVPAEGPSGESTLTPAPQTLTTSPPNIDEMLKKEKEKWEKEEREKIEKKVQEEVHKKVETQQPQQVITSGVSQKEVDEAVLRARQQEREELAQERASVEKLREEIAEMRSESSGLEGDSEGTLEMAQKLLVEEKEKYQRKLSEERARWDLEKARLHKQALRGTVDATNIAEGVVDDEWERERKALEAERASIEQARMLLEQERVDFEKGKQISPEDVGATDATSAKIDPQPAAEQTKKTKEKRKTKKAREEEAQEPEPEPDIDVGEILFTQNYISKEEHLKAKKEAEHRHAPIELILKEEGLITKELLQNAVAEFYEIPFVDLKSQAPDATVIEMVPEEVAIILRAVAIGKKEDGTIIVATNNPKQDGLLAALQEELPDGTGIELVYASKEAIESALTFYRKPLDTRFRKILENQRKVAPEIIEEIFLDAIQLGASDIHFEPQEKIVIVRFRVDGVMHEAGRIPKEYYEGIVNRIKIAGNIRIDEHFAAQDGAIRWKHGRKYMDVRVSIVPIVDGEKIVMRLLSDYVRTLTLRDLGFTAPQRDILLASAHKPFGMILTTGPTGSGKSTTLYGLLKIRNTPDVNISTIEDPVEYKITGINHIQVNEKAGLTFEKGLRAIVRQDPDVILVGEIRDNTTAQISVHAALTGHLLFSTLHANDAVTAVPRLIEMDLEPYLLASTLEIIIAQRLIRRVCTHCRYSYRVTEEEACTLFRHADRYFKGQGDVTLYRGDGCKSCGHTGYKGRLGIYELLQVTSEMEELIIGHATSTDLNNVARAQGMDLLFEDGLKKTKEGQTTIKELLRISAPPEEARMSLDEAMETFRRTHVQKE